MNSFLSTPEFELFVSVSAKHPSSQPTTCILQYTYTFQKQLATGNSVPNQFLETQV